MRINQTVLVEKKQNLSLSVKVQKTIVKIRILNRFIRVFTPNQHQPLRHYEIKLSFNATDN